MYWNRLYLGVGEGFEPIKTTANKARVSAIYSIPLYCEGGT
jgi:hypothetical protein